MEIFMKKRIIALIAVTAMLIAACLFAGCNKTPPESDTPPEVQNPTLVLDASNISNYVIVRPDEDEVKDSELYTKLTTGINKALGVRPKVESDFLYGDQVAGEFEILFGETNREESVEIYKDLKYNDFVITVKGSKVIIAGGCVESRAAAVDYFLKNFVKEGAISVSEYEYNATYAKSDITISGVSITKYSLVYAAKDSVTAVNILKNEIGKTCGYRIPVLKHNAPKTDYEIAVGATNRNQGISCDYYTYKIGTTGAIVHLDAYDTYALNAGARHIAESLTTATGDLTLESFAYDYKIPTNTELTENIDLLYMRWAESWQPPEGMLDYNAKKNAIVNVSALNVFEDGAVVDLATLVEKRIVRKPLDGLKVLGNGELTKKITVKATVFSATAKEKIEAAGGKIEEV